MVLLPHIQVNQRHTTASTNELKMMGGSETTCIIPQDTVMVYPCNPTDLYNNLFPSHYPSSNLVTYGTTPLPCRDMAIFTRIDIINPPRGSDKSGIGVDVEGPPYDMLGGVSILITTKLNLEDLWSLR